MALHLVELSLNVDSPERAKTAVAAANNLASGNLPPAPGATLVAGPWVSNEEAKLYLVVDLQDHSLTVGHFWPGMANGVIAKRRLTPTVEVKQLQEVVEKL